MNITICWFNFHGWAIFTINICCRFHFVHVFDHALCALYTHAYSLGFMISQKICEKWLQTKPKPVNFINYGLVKVIRLTSLYSLYKGTAEITGKPRIFPICFLYRMHIMAHCTLSIQCQVYLPCSFLMCTP